MNIPDTVDLIIADNYCKQGDYISGLKKYEELNLDEENEKKYLIHLFQYAAYLTENTKYLEALVQFRKVLNRLEIPDITYKNIGICLDKIGEYKEAFNFYKLFLENINYPDECLILMGDLCANKLNEKELAIKYYEEAYKYFNQNYNLCNMLGHLYSTLYRDNEKEKQLKYLYRAFELAPNNRIVVKNLSYVLGKFKMAEADGMYDRLLHLNPTHSDLHAYGAYLVKTGRFHDGFRFLRHRFQKEDVPEDAFPPLFKHTENQWNENIDISDKTMLIYCEQGFGDTIMFSRFVPYIRQMCEELYVVVQDSLYELIQESFPEIHVFPRTQWEENPLPYSYWIPMMDLPILYGLTTENIPLSEGYLTVPEEKIKAYKKNINKNKKLKIGFAYEGTESSKETERDIPAIELQRIIDLPNVECYSFQYDDIYNQKENIHGFIELNNTFDTWEDTACAMKNMDLIITTDNGVMNLAGALGVKTFGLFNTISEWRWFDTNGKDLKWYKSITPITCPHDGEWNICIDTVINKIKEIK